jgi:Fe-S-cluster containining protein
MANNDDNGPAAFFRALHNAFAHTISSRREHPDFIKDLTVQAFDSFDGNIAIQTEGLPMLACHGGCADCCTIRVVATAPEIFLIARYVVATKAAYAKIGVDLAQRIAEEAEITGGIDERQRMVLQRHCPFIEGGHCLIYLVRPLACRGHASYDRRACIEAVTGVRSAEAPVSMPHLLVRSLVQNAMMSALRDAGLAWGLFELNKAANLSLLGACVENVWLAGGDPFPTAAINEVDAKEMAATFDAIRGS